MGFYDEYGNRLINEEQKIRIRLSAKARFTIEEDMYVFGVPKVTTFINTVFGNYKLEAKASLSLYLKQKQLELEELFHGRLDASAQKAAIDVLLSQEEEKIREFTAFDDEEADSRPYHINDENTEYLLEECEEEKYYKSPARYIRAGLL